MFKKVVEILTVSKEREVDIGVACDMVKTENKEENYDDAFNFLRENYNAITELWTQDKLDELESFCESQPE